MEEDLNELCSWLGITSQQGRIIEALTMINSKGVKASPVAIIRKEAELRLGPPIQKSNFFSQLKHLQAKGFVRKTGNAAYVVNIEGIRESLESRRTAANNVMGRIGNELEYIQRKGLILFPEKKELEATFFEYDAMQKKIATALATSSKCYLTGFFPKILYAYSPSLMKQPGGRAYAMNLWDRCIREKELEVHYISHFDMDYLFEKLNSSYESPKHAYEEAKSILQNLKMLLDEVPNLKIFYVDTPYGVDLFIPDAENLGQLFLPMRDMKHKGLGGVLLHSPKLALKFSELFEEQTKNSIDMRSEKGKQAIEFFERRLTVLYEKRQKKSKEEETV